MNILIDFCNIDEWTVDDLSGIYRRHGIKHTLQGDADGVESFALSSRIPGVRFYFYDLERWRREIDKDVERLGEIDGDSARKLREHNLFPGDEGYNGIFKALEESQKDYEAFIGMCSLGNLDLGFVNSRIVAMSKNERKFDIKFQPGETTWSPYLWLFPQNIRSIEEYIDIYGIVFPLYRGEGEMFSLTKVCRHCGKYFFAKTKRAEFCSDQCRKDNFRLNK